MAHIELNARAFPYLSRKPGGGRAGVEFNGSLHFKWKLDALRERVVMKAMQDSAEHDALPGTCLVNHPGRSGVTNDTIDGGY